MVNHILLSWNIRVLEFFIISAQYLLNSSIHLSPIKLFALSLALIQEGSGVSTS